MWLIVAALALLGPYLLCLWAVLSFRRRPLGLAAPLAAALLVCIEAALLHALSFVQAANRVGILLGTAAGCGLAWLVLRRQRARWSAPSLRRIQTLPTAILVLFGMAALLSAVFYLPNNGDSMTYHMARVAYWFQNASVAPYPTRILRQVTYPPGDEYLLLILQAVAASDRLANLLQFGAWILIAGAGVPLARIFGAGHRIARWGGVVAGLTPMALLQASSTQNDLLGAVMAVAIVVACVPFLHRRPRWRAADVVLLIAACLSSYLVKPTSLVAAIPFCVWGLVVSAPQLRASATWKKLLGGWPALVLALAVLLPLFLWKPAVNDDYLRKPFLYSGVSELGDRLVNQIRGVLRAVPIPIPVLDHLGAEQTFGCDHPHELCLQANLVLLNDDTVANPAQGILILAGAVLAWVGRRQLTKRATMAMLCVGLGWVLFHGLVRDNVVLPRLQLSLLVLAPIALAVLPSRNWTSAPGRVSVGAFFLLLVGFAAVAVVKNGRRPLDPAQLRHGLVDGYYRMEPPNVRQVHGAALAALEKSGCRRLGLLLRESSYDYPLSWRAMERGVEVRHLLRPDDWPCALFSDSGPLPTGGPDGWRPSEAPQLYLRSSAE